MKINFKEISTTTMTFLLFSLLVVVAVNATATPAFSAEKMCWCCIDGEVHQITPEECKEKQGRCFSSKNEALKDCQDGACWCCIDGEVHQTTPEECKEKQGRCFDSKDEALKECQDGACWCCIDGEVHQITPEECKEKQGWCFSSKDEALKECQDGACWCCIDGKVDQMPVEDCREKEGQCFSSKDEALEKCRPQDDCRRKYPNPKIKFDHRDAQGRVYIPVINWTDYSNEMFRVAPELPPCGSNPNASRTWVDIYDADTNRRIYGFCALGSNGDLKNIWFMSEAKSGRVYIVLQDRACKKNYRSDTISWP